MTNLRNDLKERHRDVVKARQVVEAAAKQYDQARGNCERAAALIASRKAELAKLDAVEATAKLGADGFPLPPTADQRKARRDAEDNIGVAERMLRTVEAHAAAQGQVLGEARQALAAVEREVADRIPQVIDEEAAALVANWQDARSKAFDAERAVRGLMTALTTTQRFAQAEKLANEFRAGSQRKEYVADPTPFLHFFERLKSDANAKVQL